MKKYALLLSLLGTIIESPAQDYQISFAGTGASTMVGTVKVENLTQGKSTNLSGSDVLHLVATSTGLNPMLEIEKTLRIYPNPTAGNSTIEFVATASGATNLELFDITGKRIVSAQNTLAIGTHSFMVSGLSSGIYTLRIHSQAYTYTGKLVSNSTIHSGVKINYLGNSAIAGTPKNLKSATAEKIMQYTSGDRLKITGTSGNFSTVVIAIPTQSKTITFTFVACTDADGNSYPVVQIGTQTWMVENLKTTKYSDGTSIPIVTDNTAWSQLTTSGYCWHSNDEATNKNKYGALYNWHTVNTGKLCPTGWHVPTDAEWTTLSDYLTNNGYGYQGSGSDITKSIAASSGWSTNGTVGTVGSDQTTNNGSGFTALPAGARNYSNGSFANTGNNGNWWTSTESNAGNAWYRNVGYDGNSVSMSNYAKIQGFSVRCVKDEAPIAFTCGSLLTINHVVSGGVAPVAKTVTYSTVTNIPGEPTKCWITSNLGADHQATAVDDATEASAGWYWQFNRKQGYKHDGTTRTPNSTWTTPINENLNWQATNDPCAIELGSGWRIPTQTEWTNVDESGSWTNWNGPWNSALKIHAAGDLYYGDGLIYGRGSRGYYWSSSQDSDYGYGRNLNFSSSKSLMDPNYKATGVSLRCIKDAAVSNIVIGKTIEVASSTIPISGGIIKVSKPDTPVDGMEITIPANSFPSAQIFKISYSEIQSHELGLYFNPISPMITVACDGGYANELMSITIPVKIPDGHIAIGFYLDETTGKLEGIPVESVTSNSITLLTRHFLPGSKLHTGNTTLKSANAETVKGANIIISSISESILNLQTIISSGFKPGVDDWEFVNYGSFISPGGHCAGQSMAAMWYYFEKKPSGGNLFNKFNTISSLWQDNAIGYRFCSVIQNDMDWGGTIPNFFRNYIRPNQELDKLKYYSIAGTMLITGEPQGISIGRQTGVGAYGTPLYGGHSIVCYQVAINEGKLYISDPNKPAIGQFIEFKNNKFEPYVAKANGDAPSNPYPYITMYAKTAYIEWDKIGKRYAELLDSTIGNIAPNTFPGYTIWVKGNVDSELVDGFSIDRDTLRCIVDCPSSQVNFDLDGKKLISFDIYNGDGNMVNEWEGVISYVLLKPGLNKLGFYVYSQKNGVTYTDGSLKDLFIDFKWFNVYYAKLKIDPDPIAGEPEKEIEITAKSDGTAPKNAKYVWNFGDGSAAVTVNNDSIVKHIYPNEGDFNVVVTLYDNSNNLMVATATAKATITKGILNRLQKCQYATIQFGADMLTNDGFSFGGVHLTNRPPTLSNGGNCPLVWGGASFSVKIDYTARTYQPGETMHITGTIDGLVSASGLIVKTLTVHLKTETNTAQTTNEDISVMNVPYDLNRPSNQVFEIKGPTVSQYISAFTWELIYFEGSVQHVRNIASINYNNPNAVPRLSIYFEEY